MKLWNYGIVLTAILAATKTLTSARANTQPQLVNSRCNPDNPMDYNLACAGAETGSITDNQECISVDKNSSLPYPNYANCSTPSGDDHSYTMPNAIAQVNHAINNILPGLKLPPFFFVLIGGNDIFDNIEKLVALKSTSDGLPLITRSQITNHLKTSKLMRNVRTIIRTLESSGIDKENLALINLPNFAQVPAAIKLAAQHPKFEKIILTFLEIMSFYINKELGSVVNAKQLVKMNELFKQMHQSPEKYNLNKTLLTKTCVEENLMPKCPGLIFANGKHPTYHVHTLVAEMVKQTIGLAKLQQSSLIYLGDSLSDVFNNLYCDENLSKQDKKNCAPVTNGNGTWAAILSEIVGHCQRGYSNTRTTTLIQPIKLPSNPKHLFREKMLVTVETIAQQLNQYAMNNKLNTTRPTDLLAKIIHPEVLHEVYNSDLKAAM